MRNSGLRQLVLLTLPFFSLRAAAQAAEVVTPKLPESEPAPLGPITAIDYEGFHRSRISWVEEYLGLSIPRLYTVLDCQFLQKKLMTTGVFSSVEIFVAGDRLKLRVVEKWTTIPVIRGAYGGGTPLTVAGIYDTHAFGSLWTVGTELRRYGSAPPGGTAWIKAPRWKDGRHTTGLELWKDNRQRYLVDKDFKPNRIWDFRKSYARFYYLAPIRPNIPGDHAVLQVGVDAKIGVSEATTDKIYDKSKAVPGEAHERTLEPARHENTWLAKLIYDNVLADNFYLSGHRVIVSSGISYYDNKSYGVSELESFSYWQQAPRLNLALHGWLGATANRSINDGFYLGGFESIRGYPDGYIRGNYAAYINLEERYTMATWRYMWWQLLGFYDAGFATETLPKKSPKLEQSLGGGFRFGIPQIYRLVFRIDFAVSLSEPKARGFSFGLNQFIDPYKPL